jgi:hypothetical protein
MLSFPETFRADEPLPPGVRTAAESGLAEFLRALPQDALPHYGFGGAQELQRARLRQPYRVHILNPDGLRKAAAQQSVEPYLTATDLWVFPVLVDEQPKTLLWVDLMPDGFRAVQLGNTVLAKRLYLWEARLPNLLRQQGIGSFGSRLVQIPQLLTDFLLISSGKDEYVVPLHLSPDLSNAFPADDLSRADQALSVLQAHMSSLRSDPSGGLAPAGGSAVTQQSGQGPSVAPIVLCVAIVLTALACLWHQLRARSEGAR